MNLLLKNFVQAFGGSRVNNSQLPDALLLMLSSSISFSTGCHRLYDSDVSDLIVVN